VIINCRTPGACRSSCGRERSGQLNIIAYAVAQFLIARTIEVGTKTFVNGAQRAWLLMESIWQMERWGRRSCIDSLPAHGDCWSGRHHSCKVPSVSSHPKDGARVAAEAGEPRLAFLERIGYHVSGDGGKRENHYETEDSTRKQCHTSIPWSTQNSHADGLDFHRPLVVVRRSWTCQMYSVVTCSFLPRSIYLQSDQFTAGRPYVTDMHLGYNSFVFDASFEAEPS
jgi:hypothetical protein